MSGLRPERLETLLAQCKEALPEAAASIGANLGVAELTLELGEAKSGIPDVPGTKSEKTALAVIREWNGLFTLFYLDPGPLRPEWWGDSMAGQEQLAGLTSALAKLVSPQEPSGSADLLWEKSLADAADLHDFPQDVTVIPFELVSGDQRGHAFLVIMETKAAFDAVTSDEPVPQESAAEQASEAAEAVGEAASDDEETAEPETEPEPAESAEIDGGADVPPVSGYEFVTDFGPRDSLRRLPIYARSLLHVKVPVVVTLATKKESVSDILNLGPGAILQFTKSCEEPLDLSVGSRPIAKGEAVKVGEKFGLRIMSMLLPSDRYITLKQKSDASSV